MRLCRIPMLLALVAFLLTACTRQPQEAPFIRGLRIDAERGDPIAQADLGGCYKLGHGVAEDPVEAAVWFRKAADQGEPEGTSFAGRKPGVERLWQKGDVGEKRESLWQDLPVGRNRLDYGLMVMEVMPW